MKNECHTIAGEIFDTVVARNEFGHERRDELFVKADEWLRAHPWVKCPDMAREILKDNDAPEGEGFVEDNGCEGMPLACAIVFGEMRHHVDNALYDMINLDTGMNATDVLKAFVTGKLKKRKYPNRQSFRIWTEQTVHDEFVLA